MPLVTAQGYQLTPDIIGNLSRGATAAQQYRLGEIGIQQQKAKMEQEAAKQQQLQDLLGQLGPQTGIAPTQPGLQIPPGATPPIVPQGGQNRQAALAKLAIQFPEQFEQIFSNIGALDQRSRDEASRFAFTLSNTPPEKRPGMIQRRADQLRSEGRDPSDTLELLQMPSAQQDMALETLQIAALDPKQRMDVSRGTPLKTFSPVAMEGGKKGIPTFDPITGKAGLVEIPGAIEKEKATEAPKVQSSKLLPGGLVQMVMSDGSVRTVPPEEANAELIQAAEERGAELQGLRAGERGAAAESIKVAAESFKTLGSVRKNIANMDEGIRLLAEGAKTGVIESRLPSVRAASVKLDNLRGRLGLDVIGATTFGALSEAELKFALDTALPKGLDEDELKGWMQDKRDAQHKVAANLEEAALFLGTPGNTVADFIKMKKEERKAMESEQKKNAGRFQIEVVE